MKLKMLIGAASLFFFSTAQSAPVEINQASAKEIADALSGVGSTKAAAIVAYREAHGPFQDWQQLTDVSGIGEKLLERIKSDIIITNKPAQ